MTDATVGSSRAAGGRWFGEILHHRNHLRRPALPATPISGVESVPGGGGDPGGGLLDGLEPHVASE